MAQAASAAAAGEAIGASYANECASVPNHIVNLSTDVHSPSDAGTPTAAASAVSQAAAVASSAVSFGVSDAEYCEPFSTSITKARD